jgi:germination protein M
MKNFLLIVLIVVFFVAAIMFVSNSIFKDDDDKNGTTSVVTTGTTEETEAQTTEVQTTETQDNNEVKEETFKLYYSDEQALYLVPEERTVDIPGNAELSDRIDTVFNMLVMNIDSKKLYTAIPEGTKLKSAKKEGNTLVLDLSEEFRKNHPGGSTGISMSLGQIVLTLTEFEGIDKIKFLIEGKEVSEFLGHETLIDAKPRSDFTNLIKK